MTQIVAGHNLGLLDGSHGILDRNDLTNAGTLADGASVSINVANGNLLYQQRDAFLPSLGPDFDLVRSYNSRGVVPGAADGWRYSVAVRLDTHMDQLAGGGTQRNYTVTYGDGSTLHFDHDAQTGRWVSTDGAGAYEVLTELPGNNPKGAAFEVVRADQSRYLFDKQGTLLSIIDPNGVEMTFTYQGGTLRSIQDDSGHTINFEYRGSQLLQVTKTSAGSNTVVTLAQYGYTRGALTSVTDRMGHVTSYRYDNNGMLIGVSLPYQQTVDGRAQTFEQRELSFTYQRFQWDDHPHAITDFDKGFSFLMTSMTDAMGGVTSFEYDFGFGPALAAGDRDAAYKVTGARHFTGGSTRVVDAMGNGLATSNAAEFQQQRVSLGYAADVNALTGAQKEALRQAYSMTYAYDPDGYITRVTDQTGLYTSYTYGARSAGEAESATLQDNLLSITDRNGVGATTSDSDHFRALRQELGYVDLAGNGRQVADLSAAEKAELLARFTTRFTYDARGNLLTSTDGEGRVTSYTYNAFNKLESVTSAMGHALATSDDALSQAKRVELGYPAQAAALSPAQQAALRELYTTRYAYDARQNLVQRTDPGGDITRFTYDAAGNVLTRTVQMVAGDAAKDQVTRYSYDAWGNSVLTVDAEGHRTTRTYDSFGNLLTSIDGRGGVSSFSYDADNRLLGSTDPEGHVTVNAYDAVGNRISVTDASGHTVTRVFDRNNMLVATLDPALTDPAASRNTRFSYDILGNRTEVTDAEGRKTVYTYDARRQLVEVRTPLVPKADGSQAAYITSYSYDGESRIVTMTDPNGNVTHTLYTPDGLVRRETDAVGNVTEYLYDANRQQAQVTIGAQLAPGLRRVLKFSYDEENQLVAQVDAMGFVTRQAHDAAGNVVALADANGHATQFEFDRNNRLIKETRPQLDGQAAPYTVLHRYDANGNEIETIDENGHATRFWFDKDDNRVLVSDANGIETAFSYDALHNQTRVSIGVQAHVDAAGRVVIDDASQAQVTSFVYDEFNQVVSSTDGVGNALADSDATVYRLLRLELGFAEMAADLSAADRTTLLNRFTERFAYDRVGNLVRSVDHLGRITALEYDAMDRLQARTDAQGTADERVSSLRYDGNGNVVQSTDALGRSTLSRYDAVDRLVETIDPLGVRTAYEHDNVGNVVALTADAATPAPADRTTRFVYDLNNRLLSRTSAEGNTTAYEYDAVGNRLKVVDGRGNATRYVYDAMDRNVRIIDALDFETRYEYDGVGNRLQLIDARGGITRFAFDPGNRSIETTDAEGRITRLVYDPLGQQVSQTTGIRKAGGGADDFSEAQTTTFLYDAEGNLRSATDAEGRVETRGYDAAYNQTRTTDRMGRVTTYGYDALNRQVRITDALGGVRSFSYDAVDNRLGETHENGATRSFFYDANDRLIVETDAAGTETHYAYDAVGNQTRITRAANRPGEESTTTLVHDRDDRLVAQTDALGHTTRFSYDAADNTTVVTDPAGHATTYHHDANNRVASIVDALGQVTTYRYDGNGNRVQVIDARGHASTTYYNANDEVALSVDAEGHATRFQYDANGNVRSQTLHVTPLALPLDPATPPAPAASPRDQTITFGYDKLGRVVRRVSAEGVVQTFAYDAVGNLTESRLHRDLAGLDVAVTRSYFDALDREIARISPEGYLATSEYDAVGNLVRAAFHAERVAVPAAGALPQPQAGDPARATTFRYDLNNRLVEETSPLGAVRRFSHDARGNQTVITEAWGTPEQRSTRFAYDAVDRLSDTEQPDGTVVHLVRDADGNIVEKHEAYGTPQVRVTRYAYDGNHQVVREENAGEGIVTLFRHDAAGNLVEKVLAAGTAAQRSERFEYDRDNRLVAQVNAKGEQTRFVLDAAGNRVRVLQATGLAEARDNRYEYDRDNRQTAFVDGTGSRTEYRYDGAGNRVESRQAVGVAGVEKTTRYVYDQDNRLVEVVSPKGASTRYEYDVLGNKVRVVDGNGGETRRSFDVQGRVVGEITPEGVVMTLRYDSHGNMVERTRGSETTHFKYDAKGRQVEITDGEGFTTRITYDRFDNQTRIERGLYLVAAGAAGYSQAKKDLEFPLVTQFAYDQANRLVAMTDGEGNVTRYEYDGVGNRTAEVVAAGQAGQERRTTYEYDAANQVVRITSPTGAVKEYGYDAVGNAVTSRTLVSGQPGANPVWRTETFEYDDDGRQTAAVDGVGIRTERVFDAVGNLLVERTAAGTADVRVKRYEYNLDNQVIAEIDALGHRTEYTRDAVGNRTQVKDALGREAHYYFNGANQLVAIVDAEGVLNTFRYDASGNRIEARVYMQKVSGPIDPATVPGVAASAGDRVVTTEYDNDDNVVRIIKSDGQVIDYVNDSTGTMRQRTTRSANAADAPRIETYGYDANGRLSFFRDVDGAETTIAYDAANNKVQESITDPAYAAGDPNRTRVTRYTYDLDNRVVREAYDPNGLNISQSLQYDKAGQVVRKVDANGVATDSVYDLGGRLLQVTADPGGLALRTRFAYDNAGNQVSMTDARGNTTNFVYDLNNRLVQEILPSVTVFDVDSGAERTLRPTEQTVYDAVGNVVQTIDANGRRTTQYFNGNDQIVAVVRGDNTLIEFSYNAANELVEERLYMERLADSAHDPATRPLPVGSNVRVTNRQYDLGGRLVRVIHPSTEVTTLNFASATNPSDSRATYRTQEVIVYNGFGEAVETFDRNAIGQRPVDGAPDTASFSRAREVTYYDAKGRAVASVNALGFLTEWDYDGQDNVIAQRSYTVALDMAGVTAASRPSTTGLGTPETVTRRYDALNRLVDETSDLVEVLDVNAANPAASTSATVRLVTHHTYDAMGNETSRTRAHGTAAAATDHFYRDAAGRLVAMVNSDRVLHEYSYDANGNQTRQLRYINLVTLPAAALPSATLATLQANVAANAAQDQATVREYDAANRILRETDQMNLGTAADDLSRSYSHDAAGNRTRVVDERGFLTLTGYDGVDRVNQMVSPDGSGTLIDYDAAGNAVLIYTGNVSATILPATLSSVSFDTLGTSTRADDAFTLSWTVPATVDVQTYVVYGTSSQLDVANPDTAYGNQTALGSTMGATSGSVGIPSTGLAAGSTVYFRVVSEDRAGNRTWSPEQSFVVPPRLQDVNVAQPAAGQMAVRVSFDAGVVNPRLAVSGLAPQGFVSLGGGVYEATVAVAGDPKTLSYQILWEDASGAQHASASAPFRATGAEIGTFTTLSETSSGGASTVRLTTKVATGSVTGLMAQWRLVGGGTGFASTGFVAAQTSAAGVDSFRLETAAGLAAGTYEVVLVGQRADGSAVTLDTFQVTTGNGSINGRTEQSLSWTLPEVGDDPDVGNRQLVIIDGQRVAATRQDGRLLVDATLGAASTASIAAFYGSATGTSHAVTVDQTVVTTALDATHHRVDAYRLNVAATNLPAGARVAWRPAGGGIDFSGEASVGSPFTVVSTGALPREFDLKIFYVDASGREVIVDWARVSVSGPALGTELGAPGATTRLLSETAESMTVLARERDASVSRGANATDNAFAFARGLYTGPVSDETVLRPLALSTATTADPRNAAGSSSANGLSRGYFTENAFDALNARIATNEGTGQWRRLGVDANGNAVATYTYGTKEAEARGVAPQVTHTRFDARNYETGHYGVLVAVDANGDGVNEATARQFTTRVRDHLDRVIAETDVRGTTRTTRYNVLGLVISETATNGGTLSSRQMKYDLLGNMVQETDGLGHSMFHVHAGTRLVADVDALGNTTRYEHDAFGRQTRITTPTIRTSTTGTTASAVVQLAYDQRDRLTSVVDGLGNTTRYTYDGANNRTSMIDANGHFWGTTYDSLNRVLTRSSMQNGQVITQSRSYDYYGNVISETDEMGRVKSSTFGAFGRKLTEVDEGLRVTTYGYDDFGRLVSERSIASGKNIVRSYDDAGRQTRVADAATGVSTNYTYTAAGDRSHETVNATGHARNIAYAYDGLGRMTAWNDSAQGVSMSYAWDLASNLARAQGSNGVDHRYTYDAADRLVEVRDGASVIASYGYDAAGDRISASIGGTTVQYQYDLNGRVTAGVSGAERVTWTYDKVGNVTQFDNNGEITNYQYYENNRNYVTDDLGAKSKTTLNLDRSGRTVTTVLVDSSGDDASTFTFTHVYTADGREVLVSGTGDASGTSTLSYDANDNLVFVNLGQGDKQDSEETRSFVYNNENQILYRNHLTGETADSAGDDEPRLDNTKEYFYANSQPVGDKGNTEESATVVTTLDSGRYALVQPLGEDNPDTAVSAYQVLRGDTLQSVAGRLYGNPSLWFVLADANGLTAASPLKEGTLLQVPNTVQTGRITDATHAVYDQNEITGSTLPNLKSPEPDACAIFLAVLLIILIIIIAVVVAVVTFGAGSAVSGLIAGAGITGVAATLLTIAATAVVGAAVAFVGAMVTQGLLIAFGVQKEIDWKAVAAESVAGAFAGIASGISAAVKVAIAAGKLASLGAKLATAVKVVSVGLSAVAGGGGEALRQVIIDGKVTSWASVAGAAVGAAIATGAVIKSASAAGKAASKAAALGKSVDDITSAADKAAKVTAARFDVIAATADIVTEWAKVAELAVRHEIDSSSPAPTWGDFLTATGGTVAGGINIGLKIKGNPAAFRLGGKAAPGDASMPRLGRAIPVDDAGPTRVPSNATAQPSAVAQRPQQPGQGNAAPLQPVAVPRTPPPIPPKPVRVAQADALGQPPVPRAAQGGDAVRLPPPLPPKPPRAIVADGPAQQPVAPRAQDVDARLPPPIPPKPRRVADANAQVQAAPQRAARNANALPPPLPPKPRRVGQADGANQPAVAQQAQGGADGRVAPVIPPRPARPVADAPLAPPRPARPGSAAPLAPPANARAAQGPGSLPPVDRNAAVNTAVAKSVTFDGFKAAATDALKAELIGRATDVGFTLIIAAAYGGMAGLNWIMTGRYGKTNPGQAGRAAVAGATSLQLAGNGRQLRLLGSPIDVRSVNTGSQPRSLVGVPMALDPMQGFAQIAALVGKDLPVAIGG